MRVEIANRQAALTCPSAEIRAVLRRALQSGLAPETEQRPKAARPDAELSVALVGDAEMAELHKRFLGRRRATDVLAFPYEKRGALVTGEIVVNAERAVREAAGRSHGGREELLLYVVHGMLHLLGYDDHTASDRRRMREREQAVLRAAGHEVEF